MLRPCIDLHEGKVKQIVGGTLGDSGLRTNFVSERPAEWYADLYRRDALTGGHVIMLGPGNEAAARAARAAPGAAALRSVLSGGAGGGGGRVGWVAGAVRPNARAGRAARAPYPRPFRARPPTLLQYLSCRPSPIMPSRGRCGPSAHPRGRRS